MSTVLLRSGTAVPADAITPVVPALAEVQRRISARSSTDNGAPLVVDTDLFERAEKEMIERMKERGYDRIARAFRPERNFLFNGMAIVCEGE